MELRRLPLKSSYLDLPPVFYDLTEPTPLRAPFLIHANENTASLVGLDLAQCDDDELCRWLNGEILSEESAAFAMCYAGHQFGYFVPRLGDGRAINLGERNGWHLQLKGAGQTLYSRQGDGRAVLRSSIREYLMSEAMHHLGIPTTRALAIIGSHENVAREHWEKGAIVMRLSSSWVRFGTFEYFYHANRHGDLETLADYVIAQSYPELVDKPDRYFTMFETLVERTARLIAMWQAVGFNHGVMNTDNMSIAGLTIDYGPFAFLDSYDHYNICNHTDHEGRYSFSNQPSVAKWNLRRLMVPLSVLVNYERMNEALERFDTLFHEHYLALMLEKIGLYATTENDLKLVQGLFSLMHTDAIDYTPFFRRLSHYDGRRTPLLEFSDGPRLHEWLDRYDNRLEEEITETEERHRRMQSVNPKYVLKNHLLQEVIERAEQGDFTGVDELMQIARNPFDELPQFERYAEPTPKHQHNLKLSCSS